METALLFIATLSIVATMIFYGGIFLLLIQIKRGSNAPQESKPHKPLFKPKEHKETEEEKKQRIINTNIENYNGTSEGQVKV